MEMNGSKHVSGIVVVSEPPSDKADSAETFRREQTEDLREEVSQLRLEVEELLERQRLCSELRYPMTPATAMARSPRKTKPIPGLPIALAAFAAIQSG